MAILLHDIEKYTAPLEPKVPEEELNEAVRRPSSRSLDFGSVHSLSRACVCMCVCRSVPLRSPVWNRSDNTCIANEEM